LEDVEADFEPIEESFSSKDDFADDELDQFDDLNDDNIDNGDDEGYF